MKRIFLPIAATTMLAAILVTSACAATQDPAPKTVFRAYDASGRYKATGVTRGGVTRLYSADGKYQGTAIKKGDGSSTIFDSKGNYQGRAK